VKDSIQRKKEDRAAKRAAAKLLKEAEEAEAQESLLLTSSYESHPEIPSSDRYSII
jgi:hypothetical protein